MPADPVRTLRKRISALKADGLFRERRGPQDGNSIDVSSNDYLGYGRRTVSRETSARTGAGASRLVTGTVRSHQTLEAAAADWVRLSDALLFSSGYAANVGALAAVAGPDDVIISDELNHASIVDGCRLSKASIIVFPHLDLEGVRRALHSSRATRSRWVVTESVFSMDGDSPDLKALRSICDEHNAALYVDEAHALGVLGPGGAGLCAATGVRPDVLIGALGKAVGAQGAFAAGDRDLVDFLWNFARSFVFSTAMSPLLVDAALENLLALRADDAARRRLGAMCRTFRELVGAPLARWEGPIFPVVLGTPDRARRAVEVLAEHGFTGIAIRPPTVPEGTCRLRISLRADLGEGDIVRLAEAVRRCLES